MLFESSVMAVFVGSGLNWYLVISIGLIFVALLVLYFQSPRSKNPRGGDS